MAQVKKDEIQNKILFAAETLFGDRGYVDTSMSAIAFSAGISKSNIYVYFNSKLEILWAISDPWLRNCFERLEERLDDLHDPKERLRALFLALWYEFPADRNGFANNIMQALSTTSNSDGYSRELLSFCETRFTELLAKSLPSTPIDVRSLSHIAFMAFDGFAIGHKLGSSAKEAEHSADAFVQLIFAYSEHQ